MTWFYLLVPSVEIALVFFGPLAVPAGKPGPVDLLYGLLLALHLAAGLALLGRGRRRSFFLAYRAPELLLAVGLLLFLFSYIYALNANMDYVQRFIATGGAVRLALDTTRERLHSAARYLPLLLLDLGAYLLLQQFDIHLWEPGRERVVFRHPRFTFATPICFEDAFPDDIRRFIQAGAGLIMNISNDYWSLTEVEAKQHFINSLFRAVENRRPLLRATASGLTCSVDPQGRLLAALPYYTEGYLLADVAIDPSPRTTFYTRHGDWFPRAAGALVLALILFSATAIFPRPPREKRPREDAPRRAEEPG